MKKPKPRWFVTFAPVTPANGVPKQVHITQKQEVVIYAPSAGKACEQARKFHRLIAGGEIEILDWRRAGEWDPETNTIVNDDEGTKTEDRRTHGEGLA